MKIVIYGAGNYGKMALEVLQEYGMQSDVLGFVDSNKVGEYLGLPIVPVNILDKGVVCVIAMANSKVALEVQQALSEKGMKNIYLFKPERKKCVGGSFLEDYCKRLEGSILDQVEMHIMDACNLNCRGCAHYSPIFKKEIPNFDERIRDVCLLKEKFDGILRFYILGGEPFLNPEVGKYAQVISQILPDTEIYIVTNGLLVPRVSQNILEDIKSAGVIIEISEYEPTHRMIDDIKATLNNAEIPYVIRALDTKQKFNIPLSLEAKDDFYCISNGCITIWNGKIARCPQVMYIDYFNKYFNTAFPGEGALDLESCQGGEELKAFLNKEVSLCKYCAKHEIEWSVCGREVSLADFVGDC